MYYQANHNLINFVERFVIGFIIIFSWELNLQCGQQLSKDEADNKILLMK